MTTSKSEPAETERGPLEDAAKDESRSPSGERAEKEPAGASSHVGEGPARVGNEHEPPDDEDELGDEDEDEDEDELDDELEDEDALEDEDEDEGGDELDDELESTERAEDPGTDENDEPEPVRQRAPKPWGHLVPPTLRFVAAVVVLDAMLNVRFPLDEPALWYLIPSTDVAIILLNFAIMGLLSGVVPPWIKGLAVGWVFLVRLLRFGDGIKGRYFAQRFNVYSDLGLVPDGVRFIHSTWPAWEMVLGGLGLLAALGGLGFVTYRALGVVESYLRERRQAFVAVALLALTYVSVSLSSHGPKYDAFYAGGFAASAMPRIEEEVSFFWNVHGQQTEYATLIGQTETMLDGLPSDLSKLGGANVYLILVESYGRTMFEWPPHVAASKATYDAFEKELTERGFTLATGILNSTTYGGQSWLAHATLDTGVPVHGQLEYEIVSAKKPQAIASFFRRAGYRTVLAQPNTTRAFSQGDFYDFDTSYLNKDFGYHGPDYAWATMPDQYVLDVIRRREVDRAKRPLFIQYVLVSSHAPWAKLPTLVDDWSKLGDGSIFNDVPMELFPIEWPHFENATEAYGKSIIYDFDLLRRYIEDYIQDGSLVIILGDHQPVAEVNGNTDEMGVPVHVLSKNAELVRPFITRGFRPGVRPNLGGFPQGLEKLLPNLLVDFSREQPAPP
jgi:Sulfatase